MLKSISKKMTRGQKDETRSGCLTVRLQIQTTWTSGVVRNILRLQQSDCCGSGSARLSGIGKNALLPLLHSLLSGPNFLRPCSPISAFFVSRNLQLGYMFLSLILSLPPHVTTIFGSPTVGQHYSRYLATF